MSMNITEMARCIKFYLIILCFLNLMEACDGFSFSQMKKKPRPVVSLSHEEQVMQLRQKEQSCRIGIHTSVYKPGYCNMTWDGISCWDQSPVGQVVIRHCPDYVNGLNSANMMSRECLEDGSWKDNGNSTGGWTNYTLCLLKPDQDTHIIMMKHLANIQLMSEIGYGISLAALIVAVVIMLASRRLHCKSNSLHINLFLAFILRALASFIKSELFINDVGLEKDILRNKDGTMQFIMEGPHWECKLIMTVFVYTVGVSMMWIFMEGLYLHMLVYRTFFTERHGVWIYIVLGWCSPLLYIVPWVLGRFFLDNAYCWNYQETTQLKWIIEGPIILTVLINFGFFVDIVRVLCLRVRSHRHPSGSSQHLRKVAKFALVLIPLFGVIYIITAAFPYGVCPIADLVALYFEMFYNSFQGFILALLFCFLNEEVQKEVKRFLKGPRFDGFATRTIFLSSWRKASTVSRRTTDPNTETSLNGTSYRSIRQSSKPQLHWKSKMASRRSQSDSTSGRRNSDSEFQLMAPDRHNNYAMDHVV